MSSDDKLSGEDILRQRIKRLSEALLPYVEGILRRDGLCHIGTCEMEVCGRCSRQIAGLRALGRPVMVQELNGQMKELKE